MKSENYFLFRRKYEVWLSIQNISKTSIKDYCKQTPYPESNFTYLDIIGALAYNNHEVEALAALAKWKKEIADSHASPKTKRNKNDYINKYESFMNVELLSSKFKLSNEDKKQLEEITPALPTIISKLENSISTESTIGEGIQIDGMDALIEKLGTNKFIKLAIESSYFFSSELCNKRFEEIKGLWQKGYEEIDPMFGNRLSCPYIPARFSKKDEANAADGVQMQTKEPKRAIFKLQSKPNWWIRIYQENYRGDIEEYGGGNGNASVCQLIKNLTGYDLGAPLKKKSFKNYIISHIWGNATDPRYFTNLWNIAIVPAWANHLLDKDESGTLSSSFKSTIEHLMVELYNMDDYQWNDIDISNGHPYNKEESIKGKYVINIISEKQQSQKFGRLSKEIIKLS